MPETSPKSQRTRKRVETLGDREAIRRWAESWKAAGAAMERLRREELAAYDFRANQFLINDLIAAGMLHAQERRVSGLQEQQRLFGIIRKRLHRSP